LHRKTFDAVQQHSKNMTHHDLAMHETLDTWTSACCMNNFPTINS
jgi:hypothetical protein